MVGNRDIVVSARGTAVNGSERLFKISWDHRSYDPLAYVLLFPDGRDGWHHELRLLDQMIAGRNNMLMKRLENRNLLVMPTVINQTVTTTYNRLLRLNQN